jgi:son of sevenless-like protein
MRSDGRLAAALSAPETYENDELSPLGINIGFWTSPTDKRNSRHDSFSSSIQSPTIVLGFDQSSSSAAPKVHHRTTSYSSSVGPNLEVPPLSSSLPTQTGHHFPAARSASYGGSVRSLTNRSISSADHSGAHITGPVREAVTDIRTIVNFSETGEVSSGTLEGLVQRLITNFSEQQICSVDKAKI